MSLEMSNLKSPVTMNLEARKPVDSCINTITHVLIIHSRINQLSELSLITLS